jgi:hypothetical protein
MQRLDVGELTDLVLVAPGEEPADRRHVGHARISVGDVGSEEFKEAIGRALTGIGDVMLH